jgi:hypothetical protein
MDKIKNLNLKKKINQIKEDYNNEWWRPSKIDDYDLKNKVITNIIIERISYLELDVVH